MDWKKTYVAELIKALEPSGDVMVVGFGNGTAADKIAAKKPKSLTIVEGDPQMAKAAKKWADGKPNVTVIESRWQQALSKLGAFDAIFFDNSPIDGKAELIRYTTAEEAAVAAKKAKESLHAIEKELSQLSAHYSDQEIEDFYKKIGQFKMSELPNFFLALKKRGNISDEQYKNACKKYKLHDIEKKVNEDRNEPQGPSELHLFLRACTQKHLKKGGRLSCYSEDPVSKYADQQFFEDFITNLDFDYQEKYVPIEVPKFRTIEALVMVLKKAA